MTAKRISSRSAFLILVPFAVWGLFTLFPIYFKIITAFKSAAETNRTIPTFWPTEWHPENFAVRFCRGLEFRTRWSTPS